MKTKQNFEIQFESKIQTQLEKKSLQSIRPMKSMLAIKSMRPKQLTRSASVQFRPQEKTL